MFDELRKKLFGKGLSKQNAKNRLQMVLVQDRSGLSGNDMDAFREDIIAVIGKYFVLKDTGVEIEWQRENSCTALVINTPIEVKVRESLKAVAKSKAKAKANS